MRGISKEIFLNALACPTLGWLIRHEEVSREATLGEEFRMEQGREIGRRARRLYPEGVLVNERWMASAARRTKGLMDDSRVSTIFEGAFHVDGYSTRADILMRKADGWHMIEVKSSVTDKKEFIDDMAYTTMVMERSGVDVSDVSLLLVSKDFRLGMEDKALFVEVDHTEEVLSRAEEFMPLWDIVKEITRRPAKPEPELRYECRGCSLFRECLGMGVDNPIFDIPRLSKTKFEGLKELGIACIEEIPPGFPLTEYQARVRSCVLAGEPLVGDGLEGELGSVLWPAYYLDLETVMTAIPLYPDIAPYTQVPTQYSIHKCSKPGRVVGHLEYIADPGRDCRREFTESLISDLQGEGSIIVYGNFERTIISGLARAYPDLAGELGSLIGRMVDLEKIIRKHFYHPGFHGSTSIKRTLPALVPEMSYDDLKIQDGDTAMASFAYMAMGRYTGREAEAIKRNLLEYCKRDTLAMVKLHRRLVGYIS